MTNPVEPDEKARKIDVGYACFGGAGNQFRMTGIYRTAKEAQLFCRRNWVVRPVSAEEVQMAGGGK